MPHPRPTRRDAAMRRGCRCPHVRPRGSHVVFKDARRCEPIRLRRTPTRADSGRLGPESAGIGQNSRFRPKLKKKKKKNPERTVLLNSNPTSAQIHSKRQNTLLTLRFTRFVSVLVCSLPLCVWFISLAASIHSFFSSLSRILNSGMLSILV